MTLGELYDRLGELGRLIYTLSYAQAGMKVDPDTGLTIFEQPSAGDITKLEEDIKHLRGLGVGKE